MTIDRTEGMTKLILDPATERVLGVGIVGAGAGELIAEGTLAIEMAALAKDAAESRVAAGIHYRSDITAGAELGRAVAGNVIERARVDEVSQ